MHASSSLRASHYARTALAGHRACGHAGACCWGASPRALLPAKLQCCLGKQTPASSPAVRDAVTGSLVACLPGACSMSDAWLPLKGWAYVVAQNLTRMTALSCPLCSTFSLQQMSTPAEGSCLWWDRSAARRAVEPSALLYTASPHGPTCGKCCLSRTASRLLPYSSAPQPPSHEMCMTSLEDKNGMLDLTGEIYVAVAGCRI